MWLCTVVSLCYWCGKVNPIYVRGQVMWAMCASIGVCFFVAPFHIITPLRPFGTSKKRSERFYFAIVACILSGRKYRLRVPRLAHGTSFWTSLTLPESDHFLFWFWPFSTWKIHNVATTLIHTKGRTQSQIMWTHFSGQLQRWVNIRCKCHTLKKKRRRFFLEGGGSFAVDTTAQAH